MYNLDRNYINPYFNQSNNSPMGAIGQILGAVIQRNKSRQDSQNFVNMLGDQANFGKSLDGLDYGGQTTTQDLGSRATSGSDYLGKNSDIQATQANMPSTGFLPPSSDTLGQGLIGQPAQQAPQQNFFAQGTTDTTQPVAKDNLMGQQYSQANNPTQTTTSAPMSLQSQVGMVKSSIAPAMKQIMTDHPDYDPKQVYALLNQAATDKITQHTADYNQQQSQVLLQQLQASKNPLEQSALAARLKGQFGIDVGGNYKDFKHDYSTVNTGDAQTAFDKNDGTFGNKVAVNESPDNKANNTTKITTTGMNNQTSKDVANINGSYHLQGIANTPHGGNGNGQPKQVHIQGKSGQIYTPMQISQARNDAAAYYQAQGDGSMELATPADHRKWNQAAFIVNDQQ